MPKFAYAAIDASGATIEGFEKGDTLGDVRANLLAKNEQARSRVEAMIARLKSLEQNP